MAKKHSEDKDTMEKLMQDFPGMIQSSKMNLMMAPLLFGVLFHEFQDKPKGESYYKLKFSMDEFETTIKQSLAEFDKLKIALKKDEK